MTDTSHDTAKHAATRETDWSAVLPILVGAVLYGTVIMVGAKLLNDPDSYWHLVVGQWIAAHGTVPRVDPYSFTMSGTPWIAKEWLSQLFYAGAWQLAGWTGMVVVAAAAFALAFGIFARCLLRNLAPLPTVTFAAVAFLLAAPHAVARPHLLALPVMVAFVAGLVRAVDEDGPPSWWLLPLMTLWANLHGGSTFGLLLVAACALDAIVLARPAARLHTFAGWFLFGLLAIAAACVTPYGPESMLVAGRILGMGSALSIISEWAPANFGEIGGFEITILLAIGLVLYSGFALRPVRIVVVLGLLHMALFAERNAELFALLVPLFVAAPLARQFPALAADGPPRRAPLGAVAAALAALIPLTVALAWVNDYRPDPRVTPAAAVEALLAENPGPVFNDYTFGGYLIHAGVPPFVDGRAELYGGDFVSRYHRAASLADLADFLALLDQYDIGATLLMPQTPAVAYLDTLPGLRRLHSDDIAVVHVRAAP